jgi:hypothetical protein
MLSSHLMAPRQGHLEQCFHIFSYLDPHENSTIVFDSSYRTIDDSRFTIDAWSQFYPGATEAIPPNIPRPLGLSVVVTCYRDADHAGYPATWISHSGMIVYVNTCLSLGILNARIQLNLRPSGRNSLPCVLPLSRLKVYDTNCAWWAYLSRNRQMSFAKTSPYLRTVITLSPPWRKSTTRFLIIGYVRLKPLGP